MARERLVTRTIYSTAADVLTLDVNTQRVTTEKYIVPGKFDSVNDLLKAVKRAYETETVKPTYISTYEELETLYGMTESDFIKYGKVLPPRKDYSQE